MHRVIPAPPLEHVIGHPIVIQIGILEVGTVGHRVAARLANGSAAACARGLMAPIWQHGYGAFMDLTGRVL
jgi:hypothetical protein